ncbi:unnamed protein product [Wuchereria bancrofti]|uniref:Uncharacterized protein n=1 Tax=Wuchereria bancrofti TaxID=6293 RepID=A0A3P7G4N9_WUCBA|nr:unnamed protein product [Wuchereria bancrofti]
MAAVRDSLCNMEPVQIPRPQISGLQFIPTRGRLGFYATIRRDGEKYGVGMKPIGPRRPVLSDSLFKDDCNISKSSNTTTTDADDKMENVKSSPEQVLFYLFDSILIIFIEVSSFIPSILIIFIEVSCFIPSN